MSEQKRMSNDGIREALNTAVDALFDVGQELERRGWGQYSELDAARLAGRVESYRDGLLDYFEKEVTQ